MPNRKAKILHANEKSVIFETTIGKDRRLTVPIQLSDKINLNKPAKITIEQV